MILQQIYLESLGHASYLVGSDDTGDALVLDPRRDVDVYLNAARDRGLRVRYSVETHQHNDYVAGSLELAARMPIDVLTGSRSQVKFPGRLVDDGERVEMGEILVTVLHTPGHTPEHISLLLTDRSRGDVPAVFLSGGALLVGDVARPDLLGGRDEAERQAATLCHTLRNKVLPLSDFVEVYPTHVAGSLCGGQIGSRLSTTIGYERRMNPMLSRLDSRADFVGRCVHLGELPAVPPYWPRMRRMNQEGPPVLGSLCEPPPLQPAAFKPPWEAGSVVLDCRSPEAFGGGHIPGALNAGYTSSFPTWAGTVLPPDEPYLLVLERPEDLWPVCWDLLRIGYGLPNGWLAGGMFAWRTAAFPLRMIPQWSVRELDRALKEESDLLVLDVRQPKERTSGHIHGSLYITGAELPARWPEIPRDRPLAVICGSGYRSSVAASWLARQGYGRVANILGGMTAWQAAGLPTASES